MPGILVIDDEPDICRFLEILFKREGYDVTVTHTAEEGIALLLREIFEIVITDLNLPGLSGMDVVEHVKRESPVSQVIVITGYGTIETAVKAIKNGAYDYLTKPLNINQVRTMCKRAIEKTTLIDEIEALRRELHHSYGVDNMVGKSTRMYEVFKLIKQTATSDCNVIITGESGTGKELVAKAIHYNSGRRKERFVPVNCGAISRELIESELFGHVKGAFTGAIRDREGFFETASSGTLFLDEITETPPEFQVKLLRVLQEGEFYRVGSSSVHPMNARVIAASNRDIETAVRQGTLREDLFYRLNVMSVHIPALRQRREDIPLLTLHFLDKFSKRDNMALKYEITQEALEILSNYTYPGNVRELENAIEYAVATSRHGIINPENLPVNIRKKTTASGNTGGSVKIKPLKDALFEYERSMILAALRETDGNISASANLLGLFRQSLQRKIKEHSISVVTLKNK
ncbi:MAG: sigma-54 dependent transcriptional regulator [Nitrospirae bacterium YQR-1]